MTSVHILPFSSITVLERQHGLYVEVARADDDQVCEVHRAFPLRIVPQALLD